MDGIIREMRRALLVVVVMLIAPTAARAETVTTLPGYRAPGTPVRYDRVTVVKEGPASAQRVLGVRATRGRDVRLPIYALETGLGKGRVLKAARALARRSHAPLLVTSDDSHIYAHCDPLFAVPADNHFLTTVAPFLRQASSAAARTPRGG
jgi:hypothetical protein